MSLGSYVDQAQGQEALEGTPNYPVWSLLSSTGVKTMGAASPSPMVLPLQVSPLQPHWVTRAPRRQEGADPSRSPTQALRPHSSCCPVLGVPRESPAHPMPSALQ